MNVLVTGAAGFIGMHAVKRLITSGHEVTGIDNLNSYYDPALKYARLKELGIARNEVNSIRFSPSEKYDNFSFLKVDICDRNQLNLLFRSKRYDLVLHLAAQAGVQYSLKDPDSYIHSNIFGFYQILDSCRNYHIPQLIFASSSSVYGLNDKYPYSTDDDTNQPANLYAATKKSNELMAYAYAHTHQLHVTALRFFTVYGPWGRPDMAPYLFTDAVMHHGSVKLNNNGEMWRDFTYIDDIIDGLMLVTENSLEKKTPYFRVYNIGNSQPSSVNELMEIIEHITGKSCDKIAVKMPVGDVIRTYADIKPLQHEFGFKPTTGLKEGMQQFIDWYEKYHEIK